MMHSVNFCESASRWLAAWRWCARWHWGWQRGRCDSCPLWIDRTRARQVSPLHGISRMFRYIILAIGGLWIAGFAARAADAPATAPVLQNDTLGESTLADE